jgi:uncharacterized protein YaaQ
MSCTPSGHYLTSMEDIESLSAILKTPIKDVDQNEFQRLYRLLFDPEFKVSNCRSCGGFSKQKNCLSLLATAEMGKWIEEIKKEK